jgi:hypothetical protein
MSRTRSNDRLDEQTRKRKMRELARSSRATAPVYAELFRREYGEEP